MKSPSLRLSAQLFLPVLFLSCSLPRGPEADGPILIASWNVLSLFDGVEDGREYPDYSLESGRWSEALYRARLEALSRAILGMAPDGRRVPGPEVLCLVEIEKSSILEDLAAGPLSGCAYRWKAFAKAASSPLGIGILSRLPLEEARAWGLDLGSGRERPILEARLKLGGSELALFVNHWKSKLEGGAATEPSRLASAALLASLVASARAASPGLAPLACGDFNEGPAEGGPSGGSYSRALSRPGGGVAGPVVLLSRAELGAWEASPDSAATAGPAPFLAFSPWDEAEGFSYLYKGVPDRIDGFLLGPELLDGRALEYQGFRVQTEGLLDARGAPLPWSGSTGRGCSDHLPILLELAPAGRAGAVD